MDTPREERIGLVCVDIKRGLSKVYGTAKDAGPCGIQEERKLEQNSGCSHKISATNTIHTDSHLGQWRFRKEDVNPLASGGLAMKPDNSKNQQVFGQPKLGLAPRLAEHFMIRRVHSYPGSSAWALIHELIYAVPGRFFSLFSGGAARLCAL